MIPLLVPRALPAAESPAPDPSLVPLLPADGARVRTNAPTLAWRCPAARQVEVWIDGRRLEVLAGDIREYVPVPLSFGAHRWKIVADFGDRRGESAEAHFVVDDAPLEPLPPGAVLLRAGWRVAAAAEVGTDGATLSGPGVDDALWSGTSLPATVLTVLARNGVYPNPYYSRNNTRIPDANSAFNREHDLLPLSHLPGREPWAGPYWFRTSFRVPAAYDGKRVWLTLNEINYRAEPWLNGVRLGTKERVVGMERRFRFDITDALRRSGDNFLAIAIHPVDIPGKPEPCPVTPLADPGRNMGADADISLNYTKWDTVGWDWQPEVRDRDMGITEDVYLSATDSLVLADPYVTTKLPLPETTRADLAVSFDVQNLANGPTRAQLEAELHHPDGRVTTWTDSVELAGGATTRVDWNAATQPALHLEQPALWWPAQLGGQPLYRLVLRARAGAQRAEQEVTFGVREFSTRLDPHTHSRIFTVNGRDLYGQGGNWVIDMALNWTASRYEQEILSAVHARLNFLRVWGPTGVAPQAFYDAADRYGMLIQQDFLHDHWGTDQNKPGFAPPADIFEQATIDIIKRLRNHPALFLWCGGNEGPNPREDLITHKLLPQYDPRGSRYYLNASLSDGLQGGGPYHNLVPREYYNNRKLAGFNSEVGPSGVPVWESMRKFLRMPPEACAPGRFPLDGEWAYHDANDRPGESETRKFSTLDTILRRRFGAPRGEDLAAYREYATKAQMVSTEAYRAAVEALNKSLWKESTGFAIWKFNASWPSLTWQITDWYQQCNAGFYAFRRSLAPLHVQLNQDDRTVAVINRGDDPRSDLRVEVSRHAADGKLLGTDTARVTAAARAATPAGLALPAPTGLGLVRLRLRSADGAVLAENLYWEEPNDDFSGLAELGRPEITAHAEARGQEVRVTLRNTGRIPALLVRVALVDGTSHSEVLPTWWSDNYVHLLPGESVEVSARPGDESPLTDRAVEVLPYPGRDPVYLPISR